MKPLDRALAKAIGERVAELRMARQWTQAELARRASMERPNYCRLEKGHHVPTLPKLLDVAAALDVTLAHLLQGVGGQARAPANEGINQSRAIASETLPRGPVEAAC